MLLARPFRMLLEMVFKIRGTVHTVPSSPQTSNQFTTLSLFLHHPQQIPSCPPLHPYFNLRTRRSSFQNVVTCTVMKATSVNHSCVPSARQSPSLLFHAFLFASSLTFYDSILTFSEPWVEPVLASFCGHLFCKKCIHTWSVFKLHSLFNFLRSLHPPRIYFEYDFGFVLFSFS